MSFQINLITFYLYTGRNNMVERETLETQEGKEIGKISERMRGHRVE